MEPEGLIPQETKTFKQPCEQGRGVGIDKLLEKKSDPCNEPIHLGDLMYKRRVLLLTGVGGEDGL